MNGVLTACAGGRGCTSKLCDRAQFLTGDLHASADGSESFQVPIERTVLPISPKTKKKKNERESEPSSGTASVSGALEPDITYKTHMLFMRKRPAQL